MTSDRRARATSRIDPARPVQADPLQVAFGPGLRALSTARKLVQSKLFDVEMCLRGILRGFGLKVGPTTPPRFAERIRDLVAGHATLEVVAAALLVVHETLRREFDGFEKRVRSMARADARVRC